MPPSISAPPQCVRGNSRTRWAEITDADPEGESRQLKSATEPSFRTSRGSSGAPSGRGGCVGTGRDLQEVEQLRLERRELGLEGVNDAAMAEETMAGQGGEALCVKLG